jgi:glycosyltransferase involved in cell wall biosynthesis
LAEQIKFLPLRPDVEFHYPAADICADPSIEDTFSLPPGEAMARGLPAMTKRATGVSEIIHHGVDGVILENYTDSKTLSDWLAHLMNDPELQ